MKDIGKAIDEGLFRHNEKSIMESKKKKEDESALADAVKLYYKMRRDSKLEEVEEVQEGNVQQEGIVVGRKQEGNGLVRQSGRDH